MYTFESRIRYSELDPSGKLSVPGVFNYFQDCSSFQSEELGVGVDYLEQKGKTWVLNAWQVVIRQLPLECDIVKVSTWASGFNKFHATRNFTLKTKNGEILAYANSIWVYVDMKTGRPEIPSKEEVNIYQPEKPLEMDYQSRKIKLPKEWEKREPLRVQRDWIDSNHHVNNNEYIKIACNEISVEEKYSQIRVEYKKQALEGDVIYPKTAKEDGRIVVALCDENGKPYAVVEYQ
ncbi:MULTISPECIES: acyl-[acyl-carrier-protein] thioesterase [Anaerostipes]|uniref:acyl-[acyl-carrier-protein] thioesterase n=1 Tax=Anaerostipes TaxID=207244 RepID=UPI000951654D|nr:acyl-ACP thioesterase domain-containing protein [Anaerostipes sp. 494a]OLR58704.1 acyl-ACP thioesterase [Anaerostipes sp. 494a]